jgi:hypothetical protein
VTSSLPPKTISVEEKLRAMESLRDDLCWFIDTDYNEESFFIRHAYFLGANDPYSALKTTLEAEIDPEAWATLNSDTSRPFDKPKNGRIAVLSRSSVRPSCEVNCSRILIVLCQRTEHCNQPKRAAQSKVLGSASVCRGEGAACYMTSLQGTRR